MTTPNAVLEYWFGDPPSTAKSAMWFRGGKEIDDDIRARFGDALARATKGELDDWAHAARSRVALVILFDQFSRNIHRGHAQQFATDARALSLAKDAVDRGIDRDVEPLLRLFLYMPFMHAEDRAMQSRGIALFDELAKDAPKELVEQAQSAAKYARMHATIIERFGRFPHRNATLGRESTAEERAWLAENPRGFGG